MSWYIIIIIMLILYSEINSIIIIIPENWNQTVGSDQLAPAPPQHCTRLHDDCDVQ